MRASLETDHDYARDSLLRGGIRFATALWGRSACLARLARLRAARIGRATTATSTPAATTGSRSGRTATAVKMRMGSARGKSATMTMPPPTAHLDTSSTISALEFGVDSELMATSFAVLDIETKRRSRM